MSKIMEMLYALWLTELVAGLALWGVGQAGLYGEGVAPGIMETLLFSKHSLLQGWPCGGRDRRA